MATASISIMKSGPARRVTPTVVLVGVATPRYRIRMSAHFWNSSKSVTKVLVLTTSAQVAPAALRHNAATDTLRLYPDPEATELRGACRPSRREARTGLRWQWLGRSARARFRRALETAEAAAF